VPPENIGGMRRLMRRQTASLFLLLALVLWFPPSRALAGDPFEIQVYDATANPPGVPGLELHLNNWTIRPDSALTTPPEYPLAGQFHATLEPSLGITPFWELGAYVQMALRTDSGGTTADWAGAKLRSKFVTPPGWDAHWRLGLNLELDYLPPGYDASRWGGEIRPIVAWQDPDWLLAFNPIVDQSFAPPGASQGPDFEPALKIARTVGAGRDLALGIEYYATLGPFSSILPWRDQQQQIFEVLDVLSIQRFELNFGVGEGLSAASEGVVIKAILGYSFEPGAQSPPATRPPLGASNWRRP
jgi:hypothetical protein